jgi:hypothetical protein
VSLTLFDAHISIRIPSKGNGPNQHNIYQGGEAYMLENFPKMDRFLTCSQVPLDRMENEVEIRDEEEQKMEVNLIRDENEKGKYLREQNTNSFKSVGVKDSNFINLGPWSLVFGFMLFVALYLILRRFRSFPKKERKSA